MFLTPDNTEIVVLLFFPYLETLNSIQNTAQCGNISLFLKITHAVIGKEFNRLKKVKQHVNKKLFNVSSPHHGLCIPAVSLLYIAGD